MWKTMNEITIWKQACIILKIQWKVQSKILKLWYRSSTGKYSQANITLQTNQQNEAVLTSYV